MRSADRLNIAIVLLLAIPAAFGFQRAAEELETEQKVLWADPGEVESLDFNYGIGGVENLPEPPFEFVSEDISGTSPKVNVTDGHGKKWNVKWGEEASSSTFSTRLVWACGYFVEPEYFVAHGRIDGVHGLKRAKAWMDSDGSFVNARFQLRSDWPTYLHGRHWTWTKNPFPATHQIQGLKILILLVSNWDTKTENLSIFEDDSNGSVRHIYADYDWGASMGKWGGRFGRSKWDCNGFTQQTSKFVTIGRDGSPQWGFRGKHEKEVTSDIKIEDIQWLLQYLGRITDEEIIDGLAASGATPENVDCFARPLRSRIEQLQQFAAE